MLPFPFSTHCQSINLCKALSYHSPDSTFPIKTEGAWGVPFLSLFLSLCGQSQKRELGAHPYSATMSNYTGTWSLEWIKNGQNKEIMCVIKSHLMGRTKAEGKLNLTLDCSLSLLGRLVSLFIYIQKSAPPLEQMHFEIHSFPDFRKRT